MRGGENPRVSSEIKEFRQVLGPSEPPRGACSTPKSHWAPRLEETSGLPFPSSVAQLLVAHDFHQNHKPLLFLLSSNSYPVCMISKLLSLPHALPSLSLLKEGMPNTHRGFSRCSALL